MKVLRLAVCLLALLGSAAAAKITYEGGDGSTMAQAVIIADAVGETDGVESEYIWLDQHFHGYTGDGQALLQDGKRIYDLLTIHQSGKKYEIYFDITDYFGKM